MGSFVLANSNQQYYTRDGAFDISLDGTVVNPASGLKVQGWTADSSGVIDTTIPVGPVSIPIGQRTRRRRSTSALIRGNLDAAALVGATASTTLSLYDSLGVAHSVKVTFEKTAANAWSWTAAADPLDLESTTTSTGTVTFTSSGLIDPASPPTGTLSVALTNGAVSPLDFDPAATPASLNLAQMTQFSGNSEPVGSVNGFSSGTLVTFAVGNGGEITGVYSNGQTQALGQIAMASFLNAGGLVRTGQNMFGVSSASGNPLIGRPGSSSRGNVTTGSLEMSNVDLATQFTGMITAQRGFQANGRVITTSDEMLQELVNLKR